MTRHYPGLVVTRHQYGISALVSQTLFGRETSGSVAKCRLFPQATSGRGSCSVRVSCNGRGNGCGGQW